PPMKGSGLCGMLKVAEPSDACLPLRNTAATGVGVNSSFALIQRGVCSFERKVRNAQDAGFKAAIIYNNKYSPELVPMGGDSMGIVIYAVFVSKAVGKLLLKYAGDSNMECWIIPSLRNAWSIMGISFASLISVALLLAICIFVRKYWLQQHRQGDPHLHHSHGMSFRLVKALPSLIFSSVSGYNCTSETCAICLEDYTAGEKLRILPCCHKFHAVCIESWLTMWRTFCPVCKRDARNTMLQTPVTENTPLLSTNTSISSSFLSAQVSIVGSPYMHIPSISRRLRAESSYSHSSQNLSPYLSQTLGSHGSSSILSRNSGNFGNTSLLSVGVCSSLFSPESSFHASPEMTPPSVNFRYSSLIPCTHNGSPQVDASPVLPPLIPFCG
ncbi:hypothetical protein KI387_025359, partial [Taxus chinensis]